jgi:hypothetical protein
MGLGNPGSAAHRVARTVEVVLDQHRVHRERGVVGKQRVVAVVAAQHGDQLGVGGQAAQHLRHGLARVPQELLGGGIGRDGVR